MTDKKTFYITTPIYYPSGNLHIGHAYSTVVADSMARYKKMRGYETYFLTGTDEHGQKIQNRAKEAGVTPQEFVDQIVAGIKDLWRVLDIANDDFIRTTEERHQKVAQALFQKIYDQGDIYKSEYEGWYCTPCETFFPEYQLAEGHVCPDCGRPVEKTKEESYFFKMSKYADQWLDFIEQNPDFIQPASRRSEMINFVKQGLEDLCVSRTTFDWGIQVPFDHKHVIYVWFDALVNYISALGYGTEDDHLYQTFWPADVHVVGKDIIRFHTIIWPIMLMAAGIPFPKKVFAHGWVLLDSGKMSKSVGNVVDPVVLVEKYGVDAVRYFLTREMAFGQDSVYSETALANRINVDLANDYGNLLSRVTSMMDKFAGGVVEGPGAPTEFDDELIALAKETPEVVGEHFDKMDFANGLAAIMKLVGKANKYVDETAPWALNKAGEKEKLKTVLYNIAEVLRLATIMLTPVMPRLPQKVWEQLGIAGESQCHTWDSLTWGGYPAGTKIKRGEPLFPRVDVKALEEAAAAEAEAKATAAQTEQAPPAVPTFEPILPEITIDDFGKLDLRVAEVLACEKVKKADKLLQFRLKVGDEERTVVSGIAQYYQPEELIGKKLIVVANLKPVKLRGIESKGMLLTACHGDQLELLEVKDIPAGGQIS